MATELHICRPNSKLLLRDWRTAVLQLKELRMSTADNVVKNPRTGAEIRVPGNEGDVEMYFEGDKQWNMVFRWREGTVLFKNGSEEPEVLSVAHKLASIVGGEIRSDGGEVYKPNP